jgi:myo-inositol-1(or 4)-monophosphatase
MIRNYRAFAVAMAKEAGAFLKARCHDTHSVHYKGEINIVTEEDRLSEDMIVSRIRKHFPDHDILTEESKGIDRGSDYRWIIDPLDGTTNYAHGYPVFCVSIALEKKGDVILGVIYNPMLRELFVAEKNKGAFLNRKRLSVSGTSALSRSLLATGFPYDIRRNADNNMNYFIGMAVKAQAIRRAGSAALDLAYVSAGRFDGFWELKLHPWDTAAASLMIREAGGTLSDISGNPYQLSSSGIVASNGHVHRAMLRLLQAINPISIASTSSIFLKKHP